MSFNSERSYEVRITQVFPDLHDPKYSARAVDTVDALPLNQVSPFRRWIFSPDDPPEIVPAQVGDHARVAICQGVARLIDVPEQYLVGPCEGAGF